MQRLVIINQKGGCGKTTSAINLAGVAASQGKRTLLVDLDPQSHCAAGLAIPEQRIDLDIGDAMLSDGVPDKPRLIWRAARNLDLIPSRLKLAGLEAARGGLASKPDKEQRLDRVLSHLAPDYDLCIVDCSPSIGLLTYNALACATRILIPVETSFFSLQGATKQVNTIRSLERRLGVTAPYNILATIHEPDSALATDLMNELLRRFEDRVCPTAIRRDRALREATSFGQPVVEYDPQSIGAADFAAAAKWLLLGTPESQRPDLPEPITPPPATKKNSTDKKTTIRTTPSVGEATSTLAKRLAPAASPAPASAAPTSTVKEPKRAVATKTAPMGSTGSAGSAGTATATIAAPQTAVRLVEDSDTSTARRPDTRTIVTPEPKTPGTKPVTPTPGVRALPGRARFALPLSIGHSVHVAGDFNHWAPSTLGMQRREDLKLWELDIPLVPGRYRYRIIVDGAWQTDPTNNAKEPNEFGEYNSVLIVPEA